LAARDITVNVVQLRMLHGEKEDPHPSPSPEHGNSYAIKRKPDVNEVTSAVIFLASTAASYITGAVLDVNGGYQA
jgi:NAD(P)-dependent dehydrogenase (short-subunit alcohol dehydrogenase family)